MSWEQAPTARRRWPSIAGIAAVLLVAMFVVGVLRPREPGDALTVTGPDDQQAATDLNNRVDEIAELDGETTTRSGGTGALLPGAPAMSVVIADFAGRLEVVDMASGAHREVRVFADPLRRSPDQLHVVGDTIVLDISNRVVGLSAEVDEPHQLGANHRSVTTADASSVWIYDEAAPRVGGSAMRVTLDGADVLDRIDLPPLAQPLGGTADGLVVETPGTLSHIGTDGTRRLIARGQGLASDGLRVARLDCLGDLSCGVAIGPLDDPDRTRVGLRRRDVAVGLFGPAGGSFSPDGRWLALALYRQRPNGGADTPMVAIIDVALGTEVGRVGGSFLTLPQTPLAWSRDSAWLAVSTGTGLRMWSTERRRAIDLDVGVSPTYALAMR